MHEWIVKTFTSQPQGFQFRATAGFFGKNLLLFP